MVKEDTIELEAIFAVLRRWAWLIAGCAVLGAAIAYVVTSRMPPSYRATTTLLVNAAEDPKGNEYNTLVAAERLGLTYSQMLKQPSTLQAAISRLDLPATPEWLAKRIKVEPVKETQLIRLTVTDSSPTRAALLADAVADAFIAHSQGLQEERYSRDLSSAQAKKDEQLGLVQQTQAAMDDKALQKLYKEAEISRLQDQLANYRIDNRALQQNYQSLQLTVSRLMGTVSIVDASRVLTAPVASPISGTVTLLVAQATADGQADYTSVLASERLAGTYAQMLVGRPVLEAAIAGLQVKESADALAKRVKAEAVPNTQLIRVTVAGPDRARATMLANAIAEAFVEQVQTSLTKPYASSLSSLVEQIDRLSGLITETQATIDARTAERSRTETDLMRLETLLTEYRSSYAAYLDAYEGARSRAGDGARAITIADRAAVPKDPALNRSFYTLIAGAAAGMIALSIVFVVESLNTTIKTPKDVSKALDLTTLATISRFDNREERLVVMSQPQSAVAEAFRLLATNIRLCCNVSPLGTLLVTSATYGEGKSVVAANLAVAMAKSGLRVVAVDADLRAPRLHELFGLHALKGLSDALLQQSLDGCLQATSVDGLSILVGGKLPPDPVREFSSPYLPRLLAELGSRADIVLVDSPPLLAAAETTILASAMDGVLLVVRAGRTRTRGVQIAADALLRIGARRVGAVLNGVAAEADYGYHARKYNAKQRKNTSMGPGRQARPLAATVRSVVRARLRMPAWIQRAKETETQRSG